MPQKQAPPDQRGTQLPTAHAATQSYHILLVIFVMVAMVRLQRLIVDLIILYLESHIHPLMRRIEAVEIWRCASDWIILARFDKIAFYFP